MATKRTFLQRDGWYHGGSLGNGGALARRQHSQAAGKSNHQCEEPDSRSGPWSKDDDVFDNVFSAIEQTVFVVDADTVTCQAVCELASTMNLRCETYASGQDFLKAYDPSRTGCVVLELRIPGITGLQVQEYLNTRGSTLPVIFLTAQASVSKTVRVMRYGALTVLEKPFREHEVWDAIEEAVHLNRRRLSLQAVREQQQELLETLTPKEREVFVLLAEGKSKKVIASELEICIRTVEIRRNRVMEKLRVTTMAELVRFAMIVGDGNLAAMGGEEDARSGDGRE